MSTTAAIAIPADPAQPLRRVEIDHADRLGALRGNVQVLDLHGPSASLYLSEEGKLRELELNARATGLLWVHNSQFRGADYIAGDAFLLGPVDRDGDDTTVPHEYLRLLLTESGQFRVEAQAPGSVEWRATGLVEGTVFAAYARALTHLTGNPLVEQVRVVSAPPPAPIPEAPQITTGGVR